MTEIDYAFWCAIIVSAIYGANDKTWQATAWTVAALAMLVASFFVG